MGRQIVKTLSAIPASIALVLSLSACDRAAAPAEANAAVAETSTADAEAVKQAFAKFNADIAAKNVEAITAHYADDAVMMIPGQAPFQGKEAIASDYKAYAADSAGKFVSGAEKTEVSAGGAVAFGEVNYQSTFTNPKTKVVETSDRYNLTVYKKQADGSWKVVRDVNVPLPKAG
jgi:uncharacterized protein (TIGR02246 family)